jgi:hypothetical protein
MRYLTGVSQPLAVSGREGKMYLLKSKYLSLLLPLIVYRVHITRGAMQTLVTRNRSPIQLKVSYRYINVKEDKRINSKMKTHFQRAQDELLPATLAQPLPSGGTVVLVSI